MSSKTKLIIPWGKFKVEVDFCKLKELEECSAFLDCPHYKKSWSNCKSCRYHSIKEIVETL
jgi:hypothetical protein